MNDLISRQDAIDAVTKAWTKYMPMDIDISGSFILGTLMDLPSAESERKNGKWKPFDTTWGRSFYYCTNCGEAEDCPTEMGRVIWRFCPNCGAMMEVDDDKE